MVVDSRIDAAPTSAAPALDAEAMASVVHNIGQSLYSEFMDNARKRESIEDRWAKDLRQDSGVYDPEVLARLSPERSKVFLRLTSVKHSTMLARLMDLLFPASNDRNWSIEASPEPSLHPVMVAKLAAEISARVAQEYQAAVQQAQQAGQPVPAPPQNLDQEQWIRDQMRKGATIDPALKERLDDACDAMARQIDDQLSGGVNRLSYREMGRIVIGQALRYGTGVLKGPLVERRTKQQWQPAPEGSGWELATVVQDEIKPFIETVPVWSIYPDMEAKCRKECRFIWQEYLFLRSDLLDLAARPNFKGNAIREYITNHPDGDAAPRNYETTLRSIRADSSGSSPDYTDRYRVLERWGYLKGSDLRAAGVEIEEGKEADVFASNVWILGDKVIKAVLSPLKGVTWPYHFFYYRKDETSIFGEGIPSVMRDPQSALNASVRLMLDNAAIASGPIIGILSKALSGDQDPDKLSPWTIFKFIRGEDIEKCLKVFELPAYTELFLNLCKFFFDFTDEVTTPRFMAGSGAKVAGAGETASGLSMLMGSANINIKDLVKSWDDDITTPFIEAMYAWNMQFSDDETVKGDFDVIATGTRSLIQKEILADKLVKVGQLTADPRYAGRVKDDKFLAELFKSMDLDNSLLRDDDEFQQYQMQQMAMQAQATARGNIEAAVSAAEARGLDPSMLIAKFLAQAQAGLSQGQGAPGPAQAPQGVPA